jgi:hypothetical protein
LPDLQPNSRAIGQKDGEKWAAAAILQPPIPKSDRLLALKNNQETDSQRSNCQRSRSTPEEGAPRAAAAT